ncbi:protein unc-13 homolog D-like [Littorina saxatilis]|uniref:protein unc-13 homolog D-like n=1 Tax=Littorina saxatilis TaxID=31220 RepID=UPI0038B67BDD
MTMFSIEGDELPISPATEGSPCTSHGILGKVFRKLSLKRKSSKSSLLGRKNSQSRSPGEGESQDGLNLDSVYSHVSRNVSGLDTHTFFNVENENLYRGVLRSLLHQVGATDTQVGLRPGDLIDYIRQVFDVDQEDHEYFVRDELLSKPKRVQANVTVVEARDLKHGHDKARGEGSPYCLLTMVHPQGKGIRNSPKTSPKVSPKSSPRSSPKLKRGSPPRSSSLDGSGDVLRSQPAKGTGDPKWNEEFQLEVEDSLADEIHLCICHQDDNAGLHDNGNDRKTHTEKSRALKGFFRNILQTSDHDRLIPGCIGQVILPVREIPSHGYDAWVNVYSLSGSRSKPVGRCHLQVTLSYKQDSLYGGRFSAEDYHLAALLCYKQAIADIKDTEGVDLSLSPTSRRSLDIFAVVNGISKLSQTIMELTVLLELAAGPQSCVVTDSVLHKALEAVQMTWGSKQVSAQDYLQKMPLTDAEICLYRTTARRYISYVLQQLAHMPPLFPPSTDGFVLLKHKFGIAQHLLELDLWEATSCPQHDVSSTLLAKLQADIRRWVDTHLETIESHDKVKDAVIPEVEALVKVTATLTSHCTPLGVVQQFFNNLGVNYYRVVSFETERRVVKVVRELMMELDKYQIRYHSFSVNIDTSSRLSLHLFFTVRTYYLTIRDNVSDRDMFRLTIRQYQDWFHESLVFWLQTFKTECVTRMEKALEIDQDLVVATSLVKFSNSSVDVLSCFAKITEEWRTIDFQDADSAVMGVTKITDMICDGARMYADKVHSILERNCYYDPEQGHFDVTDRLCITLNNIEHVRQYLNELPQLLDWNAVVQRLAARHESARVGRAAFSTLGRLVSSAHADILLKASILLREIADRMKVELQRSMEEFLVRKPDKCSSADTCVGYLDTNLQVLHARLSASIYPCMIRELWAVVLAIFDSNLLIGKKPEYYEHMKKHLRCLASFFSSCGLEGEGETNPLLTELRARIDLNALPSEKLILEYFHALANSMGTPVDYLGHLAIKMAYMEETRGNVTIFLKVIRGCDLPGLDRSGLSDPYVNVSLQPRCIFNHKPQKTKVIGQTLQPVFNTTFQFPNVPKEYLSTKGAALLLSVYDYDRLKSDDFAGEIVIHLSAVPHISIDSSVDRIPVIMMPLKRPSKDAEGPFSVLCSRQPWDALSKTFVQERVKLMKAAHHTSLHSSSRAGLSSFFSFFSFNNT